MTNMIIKKSVIGIILLAFTSIIFTTASPFQIANNLVENNNGLLYIKNVGLQVYADDDEDDDDDEEEDDIDEYNKEADKQHD